MFLKQAKDELILTTALYILYCLLHYFSDLKRIRSGFVGKVGLPALKGLLDDLWQRKVLSTDDKDTVLEPPYEQNGPGSVSDRHGDRDRGESKSGDD